MSVKSAFKPPDSFQDVLTFLGSQDSKRIANNTMLVRGQDDSVNLTLHGRTVIVYTEGRVFLYDAGWQTVTTKRRLNQFGPVWVYQRGGTWYVGERDWYSGMSFTYDGLSLANGIITSPGAFEGNHWFIRALWYETDFETPLYDDDRGAMYVFKLSAKEQAILMTDESYVLLYMDSQGFLTSSLLTEQEYITVTS